MSVSLAPALPLRIAEYFATSGQRDVAELFAVDAVVIDEGETHRGLKAIEKWLASVEARYRPRYVVQDGDSHIVAFEVSGTFPGSPAGLRQAFRLNETGKILHLQTL